MMKRIMSILLTISFAAGIAGCTTIGETTQTTQPTIISGQVTTTVPATTIAVSVAATTVATSPTTTEPKNEPPTQTQTIVPKTTSPEKIEESYINTDDSETTQTTEATDNEEFYPSTTTDDSYEDSSNDFTQVEKNDSEETYIYVDIENQILQYFKNGELMLSSQVVTGADNGTPVGMYEVVSKYRNIVLTGDNYESPVQYWIGFLGSGYGFHDASWRWEFGGNIYKYNGSHGCVNMPLEKVAELYEMVDIGTPVFIS